jgi:predicted Zn-dependent protease with MMP-like domain
MAQALERRRIIMNFSTPPAQEDIHAVAIAVLESMPDELSAFIEDMDLLVEELPPRELLDELELENEFDLLAVYRDTTDKIPGVVARHAREVRRLTIFRRSVLDLWCDTGEDLVALVRNVIVSEIAQANGFSDEEIETLCAAAAEASTL